MIEKILMKWGLENHKYDMVHFIYTELNIGIPVSYLYKLPGQKSSLNTLDTYSSTNYEINKILSLFPKSKYTKLEEWGGLYGYRYK